MYVISEDRLAEFCRKHPNAETGLRRWYKHSSLAQWQHFVALRRAFPSADLVGKLTVFNIKGNHYRLTARIHYRSQKVFIRSILTHAEYSKNHWKK